MLKSILGFFDTQMAQAARDDDPHAQAVAACALLVEMVGIDQESHPLESLAVRDVMSEQFKLTRTEVDVIIELAHDEVRDAVDYFQFTSLINATFPMPRKIQLVEALWRVAYADAEISAHERHMMRKIEALLHITHADHVLARDRARQKAGNSQS